MIPLLLGAILMNTGFIQKTTDYQGAATKYVVWVPEGYDAKKPMPAILSLHGVGEIGTDGWKQLAAGLGQAIIRDADRWNFIVLFPQMPPSAKKNWMNCESLLLDILEKTRKEYAIDASRFYLTGLSMGGYGSWRLAAKHPRLFAAVAPICGGGDPASAASLKGLPIWAFHGEKDEAIPPARSQEMVDAVNKAGGSAKLTIYPGVGHNSWDKAYRDEGLHEWFLRHRN